MLLGFLLFLRRFFLFSFGWVFAFRRVNSVDRPILVTWLAGIVVIQQGCQILWWHHLWKNLLHGPSAMSHKFIHAESQKLVSIKSCIVVLIVSCIPRALMASTSNLSRALSRSRRVALSRACACAHRRSAVANCSRESVRSTPNSARVCVSLSTLLSYKTRSCATKSYVSWLFPIFLASPTTDSSKINFACVVCSKEVNSSLNMDF